MSQEFNYYVWRFADLAKIGCRHEVYIATGDPGTSSPDAALGFIRPSGIAKH